MFGILSKRPLVSICIPAYQSQDFIRETIQSAFDQTIDDIEVVISNDGGHRTPDFDPFRSRRNFRISEPRERVGWVENSNLALSMARGDYFMILPHDDTLSPNYLEACIEVLQDDAEAFAAYSNIRTDHGVLDATEVCGPPRDRVIKVMRDLYNGYSYRALMRRRRGNWRHLKLIPNLPTNFCVDSTWILQQAGFGHLRQVPHALYWKRVYPGSARKAWAGLPVPQLRAAWRQHCLQMGQIANRLTPDAKLVSELVAHRLDARRVAQAPNYLKAAME